MTISWSQRAAIAAVGALNLAILVATSPPEYGEHVESRPLPILLTPDSPLVYVDGVVEAGEDVNNVHLSVRFTGDNLAAASGQISLYELPEDSDTLPEDALPLGTAVVEARAGEQAHPVTFSINHSLPAAALGDFHWLLVLEGEAELDGDLVIGASTYASKNLPELWVKLHDVEASAGEVAP